MGSTERVRGYARQRGLVLVFPETFGRLTARQQRRVGHKENRDMRRTRREARQ